MCRKFHSLGPFPSFVEGRNNHRSIYFPSKHTSYSHISKTVPKPMPKNNVSALESLESKLKMLSPLSSECCIYRVPERLLQINEKVYTPQVVSIGPLHHAREKLQFMEEHKHRYLNDFLGRTERKLGQFVQLIEGKEKNLRGCYSEAIRLTSDRFVEMIMVDATFIIEVLLRYSFPQFRKENDHIFNKPFLIEDIWYDMWLIENQLPFFILEDIFNLADIKDPSDNPYINIITLTFRFFETLEAVKDNQHKFPPFHEVKIEHFTHFLRICHLPLKPKPKPKPKQQGDDEPKQQRDDTTAPSITDLHQAGVKFQLKSDCELFDIDFTNGVLKIPKLKLQLETESLFRNMIAYEQRHYAENDINDYVFIIHQLVNTSKDVELLVQNGIIENWLSDKEGASTLINNLSRGTTLLPENFYFSSLCKSLHLYCKSPLNKWRANLIQNYFNTPWAGISVFAAVFLIVLTAIQAVFSILQVLQSQAKNCS